MKDIVENLKYMDEEHKRELEQKYDDLFEWFNDDD